MLCRSALGACVILGACARHIGATIAFPAVAERVEGARFDVAPARADGTPAAWRLEVADTELFGVAGLRSTGARLSARIDPFIVNTTLVQIASPVGTHARAVAEGGFVIRGAWQGALRAGVERLALDGTHAAQSRVAGFASRVDAGRVSLLADVESIDDHDVRYTSLVIATRVHAGAAQLTGSVRIDGDRFVGAAVSLCARVRRDVALLAGYDDGAESLSAAVAIGIGPLEIATGVSQHPVLGLSRGASVAWAR